MMILKYPSRAVKYKIWSMEELSMETVAKDGKCQISKLTFQWYVQIRFCSYASWSKCMFIANTETDVESLATAALS
jgi:hypothetical protein